jgi:putative ABC transport system substrate-binding protein
MRRRALLAALPWPLLAGSRGSHAQKPAVPVVGYLSSSEAETSERALVVFRDGLKESGYVEGRNVDIEVKWAEGRYDLLPGLARELVAHKVAVLVAIGGPAARAAKEATSTIPIVFQSGGDAVAIGLVRSLSRPDGNATGISLNLVELTLKRLQLLSELVPGLKSIAFLNDPGVARFPSVLRDMETAARSTGLELQVEEARGPEDIEPAFARLARLRPSALLVGSSILFVVRRVEIVALAARLAIPAIYELSPYVAAGGLMSYGPSIDAAVRPLGLYTGKILSGAKPADLPVQQPAKFELAINLKTAKSLGIAIPPSILARADEVIE